MAKRLTDTEKWKDPWFCSLSYKDKLFWFYICDNCNHAGIWDINWPLVNFHIGDYVFNKDTFKGRVDILKNDKIFVKKFVIFQQKISSFNELNELNNCHSSIIRILKNEGLVRGSLGASQGMGRGYGNSKGNGKGKYGAPKLKEVQDYAKEIGSNVDAERFYDFYEANGWMAGKSPIKDWKAKLRNWKVKDSDDRDKNWL